MDLIHNIHIPDLTSEFKLLEEPVVVSSSSSWLGPCAFHPGANVIFINTQQRTWSFDLINRRLKELIKIKDKFVILPGYYYLAFTYKRFFVLSSEIGKLS